MLLCHLKLAAYAQNITLLLKQASLKQAIAAINEQSGYTFLYDQKYLKQAKPVTVNFHQTPVMEAIEQVFANQPFVYSVVDNIITIRPKAARENTGKRVLPAADLQDKAVNGRVTDSLGNGLNGASVVVKGTSNGTRTTNEGYFTLENVEDGALLVVSFLGSNTLEVPISRNEMHIVLKESQSELDEVVVVGYGTAKRRDLTGAVTRIDASAFESQAATSAAEFFSGTVAGIASNQGTSASGGGSLEIRGTNSLKASSEPLIVLDGAIYNGSLQDINPFDIANVDILQDASSAAVYGARAASGVVIVTTKRGASEAPTVSLSATVGLAQTTNDYRPFDAGGYLEFREDLMGQTAPRPESNFYTNPNALPADVSLEQWRAYSNNPNDDNTLEWLSRLRLNETEVGNYQEGRTIDWYDMRMQNGLRQNYDIGLSGKAKRVNYYFSTGYTANEGVVVGDRLKTWRTRMNLEGDVADFLKVGINTQFASQDLSAVTVGNINRMSPYGQFEDEDGMLVIYPQNDALFPNPFLDHRYKDQYVRNNRLFATLYAELKLPYGFKYRASFQNRLDVLKNYNFWPTNTITGGVTRQNGFGSRADEHSYEWMVDHIISWNGTFGKHVFDFTFLANAEKFQRQRSEQENENFGPSGILGWHGLQYGTNPSIANNDAVYTGDALMARLNYHFDQRYLLTLSVRRDGFSAFGQNHPRGYFPSAALAWRLSEEAFFEAKWVDDLKLRFSWGVNGNRSVGEYSALANLSRNPYFDGTSLIVGLTNTTMANPDLKWEGTESFNIGADLTAFEGRLTATVDVYKGTTEDLLLDRRLPEIMGYESVVANLGKLSNRGVNFSATATVMSKPAFDWRTGVVFSLNRNRIDRLWGDFIEETVDGQVVRREAPDYANDWFPGEAIDRVWDYRLLGIWQVEEAEEALKYGLRPGEYKAEDVNGDDRYVQFDDKQFIGYRQPRYALGWRNDFTLYKQFDVNMFIRADLGHIGAREDFNHPNSNTYDRANTYAIPYWTEENRSTKYPRLNVNYRIYEGDINLYERRSFVRLQDLSIGYRLPSALLTRAKVSQMRVFVSARNLLTVTSWSGWDPESGNDPMPRIFSLGVNASF